ncbi:MAG TPA: hypothetical protein VFG76_00705 [Candidatus Polarisedimenticolia bacterium]|nr:hypothetical protein [Candidatus Polarisedimenticolia bacterium]
MKHVGSARFWALLEALPAEVRAVAEKNYELLKSNPRHPSLQFKRIGPLWSVRVGLRYRALGRDMAGSVLWFWIGSHDDDDKLVG